MIWEEERKSSLNERWRKALRKAMRKRKAHLEQVEDSKISVSICAFFQVITDYLRSNQAIYIKIYDNPWVSNLAFHKYYVSLIHETGGSWS